MNEGIREQRSFLLMVAGCLVVFGLLLFVWSGMKAETPAAGQGTGQQNPSIQADAGNYQEVYIKALGTGKYDKPMVTVKKGIPVRLHFSAEPSAGCGSVFVMRKFGVQLVSRNGQEQTATFTPEETGTFEYSCSMRMFIGSMTVVA